AVDMTKLPLEEPEEGVFYAYANIVNLNWTLTDLRIRFGELLQVPDENDPTWAAQRGIILERVSVTIPWQQAKGLRDMLDGVVSNYEAINGELKQAKLPAPPSDKR
ncbi:MAG TPA: DUF3467 domain-containing protein, partial [Bryobacteraceae bacterium]|nr:DUF3467 domain-containing protein [Bryobacteraceae bacterium]